MIHRFSLKAVLSHFLTFIPYSTGRSIIEIFYFEEKINTEIPYRAPGQAGHCPRASKIDGAKEYFGPIIGFCASKILAKARVPKK